LGYKRKFTKDLSIATKLQGENWFSSVIKLYACIVSFELITIFTPMLISTEKKQSSQENGSPDEGETIKSLESTVKTNVWVDNTGNEGRLIHLY
jgi:hypothetical protein